MPQPKHKDNFDIKFRKVSELIPAEYNPRQLSEKQFADLKKSFGNLGTLEPAVINQYPGRENIIISGHQRLKVAAALGMDTYPCHEVSFPPKKEREANIRMNKNTGSWDMDILANDFELSDLVEWGFEPGEIGIDLDLGNEGLTDPDDVPEVPKEAKTRPGDLYILGGHRLLCGDSVNVQHVEILMDGKKADMCFTSPPYNANTHFSTLVKNQGRLYSDGYSDNLGSEEYVHFCKDALETCFAVTDGYVFWNVNYNTNSRFEYLKQIENRLPFLTEQICWKKTSVIPYRGGLRRMWEPVYVFKTNLDLKSIGDDSQIQDNFWDINNCGAQTENHRGAFPVALPEKAIELVKAETSIIFDPFLGTGTTIIAAEKNKRKCFGMELDPKYCDVIVKRWEEFTGKTAELVQNGP